MSWQFKSMYFALGEVNQMWMSLSKLAGLPDDTLVYCGHEYTLVRSMYFFQNHISGEFSCMASQMYKVAFQTNVFVSLRPKEQVIRLTNGMKGIKKGSYVIHLELM